MNKKIGGLLIVIYSLFSSSIYHAQEDVTTVGFQIKPIIETDLIGNGSFEAANGPLRVQVNPRTGMSIGMVIRRGITPTISVEVGINRVGRNFEYIFTDEDIDFQESLKFGYVNYEIPIKSLIFIRLGDNLFMNNSLGPSLDLYASDVASGDLELQQVTRRGQWAKVALEANLGLEYRTRKSGYFYLGSTYHNPFSSVARTSVRYRTAASERFVSFDLDGGYLTLDIKYFFHEGPVRN